MENKLTNEEIARVAIMYLGCDVNLMSMWEENSEPKIPFVYKLNGVVKEGASGVIFCHCDTDEWHEEFIISDVFLLLTPLENISDEDAISVAKIFTEGWGAEDNPREWFIGMGKDGCHYNDANTHQFLISKGYAVPIFVSVNHPMNGMTPIQMGIAIGKTI